MLRSLQVCALGALLAVPFATTANATESRCAPRDTALNHLNDAYGEERQVMGLNKRGVVEVFASDTSGSWTITVTTPEGMMCIVAAGEAYMGDPGPVTVGAPT